jgi:Family of unknown function (DUF6510)
MTETWVDGNQLGGPMREILTADVTVARGVCGGCGRTSVMADVRVFTRAPGLVARCPACDHVLLRLVHAGDRAWLEMSGLTCLELAVPSS